MSDGANIGLCMAIKDVPTKRAIQELYRLMQQRQMDARSIDPGTLAKVIARHIPEDVSFNMERYFLADRDGQRMRLVNQRDSVVLWLAQLAGGTARIIDTPSGAHLTVAGAWNPSCSKKKKRAFRKVDPRKIVDALRDLPIQTWEYKVGKDGRHLGPTSEDFWKAFGLGPRRDVLNTVDLASVALVAVQYLARRVEALERRLGKKKVKKCRP